jgi:hypothetical protein
MKSLKFIQWYVSEKKKKFENPCTRGFLFYLALYFSPGLSGIRRPKALVGKEVYYYQHFVNRIARPERNLYLGKQGGVVQVVGTWDFAPWHQEAHRSVTNMFSKRILLLALEVRNENDNSRNSST